MIEIWKDIKGYEGLYQVSNMGRVKSLNYKRTGVEQVLIPQNDKNGYTHIGLRKNNKKTTIKIHRLVATHFLSNPYNLPEVNHLNEDKSDNRVVNLEWCNHKYNMNYGTILQRKSEKLSIPILQFTLDGDLIKRWNGARDIEKQTNYFQSNISRCCNGEQKTYYNFKWGYEKDYEKIPFKVFNLEIYKKKIV